MINQDIYIDNLSETSRKQIMEKHLCPLCDYVLIWMEGWDPDCDHDHCQNCKVNFYGRFQ